MSAAVLTQLDSPLTIAEVGLTQLQYGQVLVRVQASGICGAQLAEIRGDKGNAGHLPHLLAFALVHDFAQRPNSDQLFGFAAGGFRDFTRIASSHPEMWRDICIANRQALLQELDAYMVELMRTRVLLNAMP